MRSIAPDRLIFTRFAPRSRTRPVRRNWTTAALLTAGYRVELLRSSVIVIAHPSWSERVRLQHRTGGVSWCVEWAAAIRCQRPCMRADRSLGAYFKSFYVYKSFSHRGGGAG